MNPHARIFEPGSTLMQFQANYSHRRGKLPADEVVWVNPIPMHRDGRVCGCRVWYPVILDSIAAEIQKTVPPEQQPVVCACNGHLIE